MHRDAAPLVYIYIAHPMRHPYVVFVIHNMCIYKIGRRVLERGFVW